MFRSRAADNVRPKVLVINYAPIVQPTKGKRLHEARNWNDPHKLTEGYIQDLIECSGGYVRYNIVETIEVDGFPPKTDGFRYTAASYQRCSQGQEAWHDPDAVDYPAIFREFDIERRINSDAIDEVWLWGFPYGGFWESTMAGRGAYFCNSPAVQGIKTSRIFVTMGFNYERGVGEMLECFGHRVESIMRRVYGSWEQKPTHAWNRFALYDQAAPGQAGCGNIHFAPNSERDYDWGNPREVLSTCDDWLDYPNLTGKARRVNCETWGNGDIREHHRWWLRHLPRAEGRTRGKLNNWWAYAVDFNRFAESR